MRTLLLSLALLFTYALNAYEDPSHVYTISFPPNWETWESKENNAEITHARSGKENAEDFFLENIAISYYPEAVGVTLEEYVTANLKGMETIEKFTILTQGYTEIDGIKAFRYTFTGYFSSDTTEKTHLKALQYMVLLDQHPLIITAGGPEGSFPRFEQTFEKIIRSLKFLHPENRV